MRRAIAALVVGAFTPVLAAAQSPGGGQVIRAKDGDVILVEHNDKVKIVRRRHANLRVVHNPEQRWVVILADWLDGPGGADGRVDHTFDFRELTGEWPLGPRWEGSAYLDEYDMAGRVPNQGMGLTSPAGLIQLLSSVAEGGRLVSDRTFADPSAVAVLTFRGAGTSMMAATFDVAEERAVANMAQSSVRGGVTMGPDGIRSGVSLTATAPGASGYPPPSQPVRVGGNIPAPRKLKHVDGVLPEEARLAGVRGMVILEIIIGTDGTVQQAKVLRSIPALDRAAIDAVKQWTYEPTYLNGSPVPVITTVTMNIQ